LPEVCVKKNLNWAELGDEVAGFASRTPAIGNRTDTESVPLEPENDPREALAMPDIAKRVQVAKATSFIESTPNVIDAEQGMFG
jgi:hypothetical protein